MIRLFLVLGFLAFLGACSGSADLNQPPVPLGDFKLGHNIAVASKAQKGPLSRNATEEELVDAMKKAVEERFSRYDGDGLYHFGISVEGYVIAAPGVPLVLSPKSIMIVNFTIWDNALGKKLNEEVHQITVLESFGSGALIGSGYTMTKEEQLEQLSQNAVKAVETYLVKQQKEQGWFSGAPASVSPS